MTVVELVYQLIRNFWKLGERRRVKQKTTLVRQILKSEKPQRGFWENAAKQLFSVDFKPRPEPKQFPGRVRLMTMNDSARMMAAPVITPELRYAKNATWK